MNEANFFSTNTQMKSSAYEKFIVPFCGFILTVASICLSVLSDLLVKKDAFFNSFESAFIRFTIQLVLLMLIAQYKRLNLLGPSKARKILLFRGIVGSIGLSCKFTAIKFLTPSDMKSFHSSRIIFGVLLGRIFMKERVGTVQLFAMFLILAGVLAVIQPTFLVNIWPGNYVTIF